MRGVLVTICILSTGAIYSQEDVHGWLTAGLIDRHDHFSDKQTALTLENKTIDLTHKKMSSYGYQGSLGFQFSIPFFIEVDGAYTKLYDSSISQSGEFTYSKEKLHGHIVKSDINVGLTLMPFCNIPWTIFPLASYNFDQMTVTMPNFPVATPPNSSITSFNLKDKLFFRGPSVGFGTNYCLPFNLFINCEATWQWRKYNIQGVSLVDLDLPFGLTSNSIQTFKESTWLQGPEIKLGLDYFFAESWFVGVRGQWLDLHQTQSGKGTQEETTTLFDTSKNELNEQVIDTIVTLEKVKWRSWQWTVSIGLYW